MRQTPSESVRNSDFDLDVDNDQPCVVLRGTVCFRWHAGRPAGRARRMSRRTGTGRSASSSRASTRSSSRPLLVRSADVIFRNFISCAEKFAEIDRDKDGELSLEDLRQGLPDDTPAEEIEQLRHVRTHPRQHMPDMSAAV